MVAALYIAFCFCFCFLFSRLERERKGESCGESKPIVKPRKPSHQAVAEKRLADNFDKAGVNDFTVKGKVPGSEIEGEKVRSLCTFSMISPN